VSDLDLAAVHELATTDPPAAARLLFEFFVLDPACGSAHFLVEVVPTSSTPSRSGDASVAPSIGATQWAIRWPRVDWPV
jgi:hypothetical protein